MTQKTPQGIDYFNRQHPLAAFQAKVSIDVRRQIYDWFCLQIGGVMGKTFLDHGATPDTERLDSNCFIKWLLADGAIVYAASPEEISHLKQTFPALIILHWPLRSDSMPHIDYILSSAVLEHVGTTLQQAAYVEALLNICPNVLLTTPNRGHWMEFHTKLPLLHWLPKVLHRVLLRVMGQTFWSQESNLNLLYRHEVEPFFVRVSEKNKMPLQLSWFSPRFMGFISNLVVLTRKS